MWKFFEWTLKFKIDWKIHRANILKNQFPRTPIVCILAIFFYFGSMLDKTYSRWIATWAIALTFGYDFFCEKSSFSVCTFCIIISLSSFMLELSDLRNSNHSIVKKISFIMTLTKRRNLKWIFKQLLSSTLNWVLKRGCLENNFNI